MTAFKKIRMITALLAIITGTASGQTNVSGFILTNTTWTVAGTPYIITGNTLVNKNITLTIEPGVVVKFDTTKTLQIDGELIAIGTSQNRITFTASNPNPVSGSWGRIQFSNVSKDAVFDFAGNYASGSIMKYCDITYGGGVTGDATVFCDTSTPYFSHCRVSNCKKHAIYFASTVGRVDSCHIHNCGGTAILYVNTTPADLIATNDTLEDNNGGVVRAQGPGNFNTVTIRNCVFTRSGDAVDVVCWANSFIQNNVFTDNANAIRGDLGRFFNATAIISDNIFTGSTLSTVGRELCYPNRFSTLWGQNMVIKNNYFENNMSVIIDFATSNFIRDNTFVSNTATSFICGTPAYALARFYSGSGSMINNVFDGNISPASAVLVQFPAGAGKWDVAGNQVINNAAATFAFNGSISLCTNEFLSNMGTIVSATGSAASCTFRHNKFLDNAGDGSPTVSVSQNISIISNNEFRGNFSSTSTIYLLNSASDIHNNDIQNNTAISTLRISGDDVPAISNNNFVNPAVIYEIENQLPFGPGANIDMANNYWGTTSTTHIDSVVLDFFDDANLSVVYYAPVLTLAAGADSTALCEGDTISLSGTIVSETGLPVSGVTVRLSGDATVTDTTDASGRYNFNVQAGGNYTITPSKNNDLAANNGVSSLDILLMQRHILGIVPLGSPFKLIAATEVNANGDMSVSTLDIVLARSLVLGTASSFPSGRLWQFVSSDFVFSDITHPFPFDKTRTYTAIATNQTNQDFIGIKLGDVNNSWDPGTP